MKTLPGVPLLGNQVTVWDLREFELLAILSVCAIYQQTAERIRPRSFSGGAPDEGLQTVM